jgi:hypothetical protein
MFCLLLVMLCRGGGHDDEIDHRDRDIGRDVVSAGKDPVAHSHQVEQGNGGSNRSRLESEDHLVEQRRQRLTEGERQDDAALDRPVAHALRQRGLLQATRHRLQAAAQILGHVCGIVEGEGHQHQQERR